MLTFFAISNYTSEVNQLPCNIDFRMLVHAMVIHKSLII